MCVCVCEYINTIIYTGYVHHCSIRDGLGVFGRKLVDDSGFSGRVTDDPSAQFVCIDIGPDF